MIRYTFPLAALACGGLLLAAAPALAQHHHGGHGHGHSHGHVHGHSHYYGHAHLHGYGHYHTHGHYVYPAYNYAYPTYSYYSYAPAVVAPPVVSAGVATSVDATAAPATVAAPSQAAAGGARMRILLPDAEGEVWIDGRKTRSTGTARVFETPPLDADKTFTYKVTAAWHHDGRLVSAERAVSVMQGGTVTVDFNRSEDTPEVERIGAPASARN